VALLRAGLACLALLAALPVRGGELTGPILPGVEVEIADVWQLPATSASLPRTRINGLAAAPDASGRVFVNDLRGPLHVIDGATVSTYLDFAALFPAFKASPGLASGFVSLAFHPDFAANGIFYTVHTESPGATPANLGPALPVAIAQHSVLSEFTAADPAANAFAGTRRELMRIAAPHHFHNLGELAFDPSRGPGHPERGLLYLGAGDFGSVAVGRPDLLQRLDTPFGAVLRIDPLGTPFVRGGIPYPYGIPAGNPYAADGDPDTFGEIFLHGVRNAHRLIFDPADGTLRLADIGQGNVEEIWPGLPGANGGWPVREGSFALDPEEDPETVFALPPGDAANGYRYPVAQYDHDEGAAIAGGVVVRGGPLPELDGKLVFGDIVNGRIFYADVAALSAADDADPSTTAPIRELRLRREGAPTTLLAVVRAALGQPGLARADLRLTRGPDGHVYLLTKQDGRVRRLVSVARQVPALPGVALPAALAALLLAAGITAARTRSRSW
jgi:glucose/arabinose dehydrogenase